MARLKTAAEMTTEDWVAYTRRHPRAGDPRPGIPPRTDDPAAAPSHEELVEAGFRHNVTVPRRASGDADEKQPQSTAELIENQNGQKRREVRRLERELEHAVQGGVVHGVTDKAGFVGKLQYQIEQLKREMA